MKTRVRILLFALGFLMFLKGTFGQEITGPDNASMNQPVWLTLDIPEGSTGKFDSGNPAYMLDTDPAHVADGAAMFFATATGDFRVVAAIVDTQLTITFAEKIISVKGSAPPASDAITTENVTKWLGTVPSDVLDESIKHPITEETMTRKEAVGQTFLSIGKAGDAIASISGMDLMLSTALVSALGDKASQWEEFADKIDTALSKLKEQEATVSEYAAAFITIGEVLINE